jgi:peptidoglycan/xylan/chitin deacetylase (PgdA/CDA1 family)
MPFRMATAAIRRGIRNLPLTFLQRAAGRGPCVTLVHAPSDAPADHAKHLYPSRSVSGFRNDLEFILRSSEPVGLSEILAWAVAGENLPPNAFHLTCDDGLREAVEVIAPICREMGVPATFFLTTRFLDNQYLGDRHLASLLVETIARLSDDSCNKLQLMLNQKSPGRVPEHVEWKTLLLANKSGDRQFLDEVSGLVGFDQAEYLRTHRPYATSDDIRGLVHDGFTIGAHTLDHPYFPFISADEQVRQASESARQLEETFEIPCTSFAFPFGADGVAPGFYSEVTKNSSISVFFDAGGKAPSDRGLLLDRLALDLPDSTRIAPVLRQAYAGAIERKIRSFRLRNRNF